MGHNPSARGRFLSRTARDDDPIIDFDVNTVNP